MTISELIEALEEIKEAEGDIEVRIQYQDDGGCYNGNEPIEEPIVVEDYELEGPITYVLI